MSGSKRLVVMLAVIGSLVAVGGMLLPTLSQTDGEVAIVDSWVGDPLMVTCGAADCFGSEVRPLHRPGCQRPDRPTPWEHRGPPMGCPSQTRLT
jgi:hypothetical protein